MPEKKHTKVGQIVLLISLLLGLGVGLSGLLLATGPVQAQSGNEKPVINNLLKNGNFESGFYPVYELGFEPPEVGQVPLDWKWFKNSAYGKYNIYNNEGFGLVCPEDPNRRTIGKNSLSIHMQSTDQMDARLGVYQTVEVVKGQRYRFSISGTVQSMQGSPEASENSHKVELVFDHSGGDDWRAIPNDQWSRLPWSEYKLEFNTSGPNDPDIATIEEYETIVQARSNKLTIFLAAWRQWPDWRSVRYTFDCLALVPVDETAPAAAVPAQPAPASPTAEGPIPAALAEATPPAEAAPAPAIIPDSGGVLDQNDQALLLIAIASLIIIGLLGAGLWNIRRKKIG
jgi:hypothetical protein